MINEKQIFDKCYNGKAICSSADGAISVAPLRTEGTRLDEGAGSMSNRACQRWPAQRYFFHRMHLQSAMYRARATASCCAPPTLHVSILEPIPDPSSTVRARASIMSKCRNVKFIIAMTAYNYLSWLSVVQLVSLSLSIDKSKLRQFITEQGKGEQKNKKSDKNYFIKIIDTRNF